MRSILGLSICRAVIPAVALVTSLSHAAVVSPTRGTPDIPQNAPIAVDGSVRHEIELGAAYLVGRGVAKDEKQAAYWYEKAAKDGDPVAQQQIGYFYQVGLGVPVNPSRAVHWYRLAAANGLTDAKVNLGVAYVFGIGVAKDEAMGARLFEEAAKRESGSAACDLGVMNYFGMGVPVDKAAAERWYATGVKLHDPRAMFDLGTLFSITADHVHDLPRAAALLHESAARGYVLAMHSLGLLLINHPELPQSEGEAARLLKQSSEAGTWQSSAVLGAMERDGKGTMADSRAAYYDFRMAALQGGAPAGRAVKNDLNALAAKLGASQTEAMDVKANHWLALHRTALEFVFKDGAHRKQFPMFAVAFPDEGIHAGQLMPTPPS